MYCRSLVNTRTTCPGSPYRYPDCCTVSSDKTYHVSQLLAASFHTTPQSAVLLKKLTDPQLVQKLHIFYATCIIHCRIHKSPLPVPDQSSSWHHSTSLRFNLILFINSRLGHFFNGEVVGTSPNAQTGGPPLVGRPRLYWIYSQLPSAASFFRVKTTATLKKRLQC